MSDPQRSASRDDVDSLRRRIADLERQHVEQQHAIDILRRDDTELERLFMLCPEMLCIAGFDGFFKRLNPAFTETLGYSHDEMMSQPFLEFVHGDDCEPTRAELEKLSRGFPTANFVNRYRCKDATYRYIEWTAMPHQRDGLIYASARDITETKLAEEALQRSQQRYRQLLAAVTTYTYQVQMDHGVAVSTEHSPGCASATGYTAEDYAADPYLWFKMIYPDDQDMVRRQVERILAGEDVPPLEHRIIHRDGSTRWIRDTVVQHRNPRGEAIRYDGLVEDITSRKRAEQWFRTILELAPDALVIADPAGRIVLVNEQTERLFGYRRDELLEQSVEVLVPETLRGRHQRDRKAYMSKPTARLMGDRADLPARRKDGSQFTAEISLSPIRMEDCTLVFSVIRDVTERRRVEKALRENETQLLVARRIQAYFLPRSAPVVPGFDIAGASYAAEYTAGDHFDYIPMAGSTLGLVVGDVSGHGFGPALLMVSLRNHLRSLIEHHDALEEILFDANRLLSSEMKEEYFITLFMGRLDPKRRVMHYINAGHPSGYVLDASANVKATLESVVMPLGILPEMAFPPAASITLEPGDIFFVLTDGILEAQAADETQFGIDRTLALIRAHHHRPAREIIEILHRAVLDFSDHHRLADDVTAVIVKVQS